MIYIYREYEERYNFFYEILIPLDLNYIIISNYDINYIHDINMFFANIMNIIRISF